MSKERHTTGVKLVLALKAEVPYKMVSSRYIEGQNRLSVNLTIFP